MTRHYSVAQLVELHSAMEKISKKSGQRNRSLATSRAEQEAARGNATPPKVPQQRKTA